MNNWKDIHPQYVENISIKTTKYETFYVSYILLVIDNLG